MDKSGARLSGEIKNILKKVSRSLYLSVNILPEPLRTHMGLGYLLCRALDTVTDAPGVSAAEKLKVLELARGFASPGAQAALEDKFAALAAQAPQQAERELLLKSGKIFSVYASVPPADKNLFTDLVSGVAAGMETDVRAFAGGAPAALKTGADLERYCRLIGGVPGVFWARLYRAAIRRSNSGAVNFPSEKDAEMIGSALQLTNILKDMAADLRLGRCYLPQEDLDTRNMAPADLLRPANMGRVRELTSKWTYWAIDRLDQCEGFVAAIPKTELALRAAVIWPVYWAMDTLEEAAHSNLLDPQDRPRIRRSRVYATIAATPPLLLSNTAFARGYRFRRETLIGSITCGNYEGRAL
ncbi:MAG: squalene/phytoene synthase family protein [Elusimicrobiales bacterium]|nr:squalene/phytoene synthase family protein [Elusimicrobiales bacterium]